MKTPMQELFDWISDTSHKSMYDGKGLSVTDILRKAESMLEKEKEVIVNAWMDDRYPLDKEWVKQCAEQYYNETFKSVPQENNVVCSECGSEYEVQISVEHNWKMYCNNCCPVRNAKTTI